MTTFCWLPPESWLASVSGERALMRSALDLALRPARAPRAGEPGERAARAPTTTWLMLKRMLLSSISPLRRAVGRHQADAAPRRIGRAARQAAAVGEVDLAGARPVECRTGCRAGRHAGALQPGEADDLAGARREADVSQLRRRSGRWTTSSPRRCRRRGRQAAGTAPRWLRADHALDHLRDGERGAVPVSTSRPLRVTVTRSEMANTSSSRCET